VRIAIGGAAKGVGMIYPNLKTERHATMLCFLTTDADISRAMLEGALSGAVDDSFNMISVDGDMSTNDSVFLLANGLAGNARITRADKSFAIFQDALRALTKNLAGMMVADGEGATKTIEIEVRGAKSDRGARTIARKISTSNLLKACAYGEDPNWGRVAAGAGASGVRFDPDKVDIYLSGIKVLADGSSRKGIDKGALRNLFKKKEIHIMVDLKSGTHRATAWTCDLSGEYVRINSAYHT
jgi:glutamate N-acetyltransferase/amino-acid N-acetyltransferase